MQPSLDRAKASTRLHGYRIAIVAVALLLLQGASSQTTANLDTRVTRILEENYFATGPGAAVLIARNGKPTLVKTFGMANVTARQPIATQSVFDLAAVSKPFTATAVLLLAGDGKLSPDDPVKKHLPDFSVPVQGRAVKISDLVHHVSGLADYTSDDWNGSQEELARLTPATHLAWINKTTPRRPPGTMFEYNDSNYALLSLIIERVSGMTFAEFAKARVFARAGMTSTLVYDRLGLTVPNAVVGYRRRRDQTIPTSRPSQMTGDGNVFSTIEDVARWDAALWADELLTAELKERAFQSGRFDNGQAIIDDEGNECAFGWVVDPSTGAVSQSGAWFGASAYIVRYLKTGLTIALLSNDEDADLISIADEIAR